VVQAIKLESESWVVIYIGFYQSLHVVNHYNEKNMIVRLRKWKIEDADSLAKHANNENIANKLRDAFPSPYTKTDAEAFIDQCLYSEVEGELMLAIDVNGEAIGAVGLSPKGDYQYRCAELGYWVSEMYWGQGVATKVVGLITERAYKELGIIRIYAECFENNAASQRVLEKCGFTCETKLNKGVYKNGVFYDSLIYEYIRPSEEEDEYSH
jgi:ribosomal-protein-alanine N-acetyltransferase